MFVCLCQDEKWIYIHLVNSTQGQLKVSNQLLVPEQAQMILVQMKQTTVAAPALTATDGSYSGFKTEVCMGLGSPWGPCP